MIVIHAPPGTGKSTLVQHLKRLGVRAVDMETFFSPEERKWAAANWHRGTLPAVLAAADLQPRDFPKREDIKHVLLLPPRPVYDARRAGRDAQHPHKRHQPDVYDGFANNQRLYDAISNSSGTIMESLDDLNRIHRLFFKRDIPGF